METILNTRGKVPHIYSICGATFPILAIMTHWDFRGVTLEHYNKWRICLLDDLRTTE